MRNKKNIIMLIMVGIMLLMATGYAYFSTKLNINATGNITSTWNVYFESISDGTIVGNASNVITPSVTSTTANMSVNLELPGDSITYELVLKNGGTVGAIIEDINAVAEGSSAIIYTMSGINIGDKLASGESKTITIKIEYDNNTTSQPALTSKKLTVTIDAVQDIGQSITTETPVIEETYLVARILQDNTAQTDTTIDFSQISSDTNGKGLYYTTYNTVGGAKTYYFRGAVENNYVKFGNYYWRIVRINEDGSIRLIYQGTSADAESSDTQIGTSAFSPGYSDNTYVGYMYGTWGSSSYASTHANTNDSTIKDYLDNWYENNLKTNYSKYLEDAGFCNDRSINDTAGEWYSDDTALGYGTNYTYYGSYNRLVNMQQPQFACPQVNDLFTTNTNSKGNKALTNPIGLITADEVAYAGGVYNVPNTSYYLYTGSSYWTMSIAVFKYPPLEWQVLSEGNLNNNGHVYYLSQGVRPVINLKADIETVSGDGTKTNPYRIKTS